MKSFWAVISVVLLLQTHAAAYSLFLTCNDARGVVVHDSTTNCFDLQVFGASWASGIRNSALKLDGQDDFLGTTNPMCLNKLGAFTTGTIAVSFRMHGLPVDTIYPVCYFGKRSGSSILIEVGHHSTEAKLYFTVTRNGVPLCFDSNFNLQPKIWYRFAVVIGPGFNTGYLNGVELTNRHYNYGDARSALFLADVDKDVFWIGKGFSTGSEPNFFNGDIDEFRISERPLSSQEIWAAYNAILTVSPVVVQWQQPPGVLVRWASQASQKYDVRYRMSLAGVAPWLVLVSNLPATASETFFLHQNGVNASTGFYRVTRSPY